MAPWAQPGVARGKTGSGQESGQYTNVKIISRSLDFAPARDVDAFVAERSEGD